MTEFSRISKRITSIAESATLKVDAKAKALQAAGRPVISYAAGEPDFATPQHIVEAASRAVLDPKNHRYTPAIGLPDLREAIAQKTRVDSGTEISAAQVVVTNGGKQAVYQAFATLLDPGDEVLMPTPYWTTYPEAIRLAGGVPVEIFAGADQGYKVTVEQLEAARTAKSKVLLFVSPSNPTGAVYSPEETEAIGRWAYDNGMWVITEAVPELIDRTIMVNGVAKTYAMTGWRVGWMIGPKDVMKASINFQSHATSNVNNVAQVAALAAVSGDLSAVAMMREAFERRGKLMHRLLTSIPGVTCMEPQGAFYCYPKFEGLLGRKVGDGTPRSTLELADAVLTTAKVAFVPGEAFGSPGYSRFSFALGDADIEEGINRLVALFS